LLSESRADDGTPGFGAKRKAPVAGLEQVGSGGFFRTSIKTKKCRGITTALKMKRNSP
jgi:hypothetical protein